MSCRVTQHLDLQRIRWICLSKLPEFADVTAAADAVAVADGGDGDRFRLAFFFGFSKQLEYSSSVMYMSFTLLLCFSSTFRVVYYFLIRINFNRKLSM